VPPKPKEPEKSTDPAKPDKPNGPAPKESTPKDPTGKDVSDPTVYITKTGQKYHADGCQYLSQSKIPIKLSEAVAKGYTPCSKCNPPVPPKPKEPEKPSSPDKPKEPEKPSGLSSAGQVKVLLL
jgi:hypothetical protein